MVETSDASGRRCLDIRPLTPVPTDAAVGACSDGDEIRGPLLGLLTLDDGTYRIVGGRGLTPGQTVVVNVDGGEGTATPVTDDGSWLTVDRVTGADDSFDGISIDVFTADGDLVGSLID